MLNLPCPSIQLVCSIFMEIVPALLSFTVFDDWCRGLVQRTGGACSLIDDPTRRRVIQAHLIGMVESTAPAGLREQRSGMRTGHMQAFLPSVLNLRSQVNSVKNPIHQ
jgi:hypothetical protein